MENVTKSYLKKKKLHLKRYYSVYEIVIIEAMVMSSNGVKPNRFIIALMLND
jgi:hypothetical protein